MSIKLRFRCNHCSFQFLNIFYSNIFILSFLEFIPKVPAMFEVDEVFHAILRQVSTSADLELPHLVNT